MRIQTHNQTRKEHVHCSPDTLTMTVHHKDHCITHQQQTKHQRGGGWD